MKKLIRHIKRWNIWRKRNGNGWLHHLVVLLGLIQSPTMNLEWTAEELEEYKTATKSLLETPKHNQQIIDQLAAVLRQSDNH